MIAFLNSQNEASCDSEGWWLSSFHIFAATEAFTTVMFNYSEISYNPISN